VLLRLLQGRPWLHRVAGRSVLIGDVPWVAQSVEAFASKLFALAYSIATCTFFSANPVDHLVHRHTHRVVRGSLLAIGRPDGRLNTLTSAEAAACLSINQASSIQNFGVTAETLSIGKNPFRLPLCAAHITLPAHRPKFMCEVLQEAESDKLKRAAATNPDGSIRGLSKFTNMSDTDLVHSLSSGVPVVGGQSREPSVHAGGGVGAFLGFGGDASSGHRHMSSRDNSAHGQRTFLSALGSSRDNSAHGQRTFLSGLGSSRENSAHGQAVFQGSLGASTSAKDAPDAPGTDVELGLGRQAPTPTPAQLHPAQLHETSAIASALVRGIWSGLHSPSKTASAASPAPSTVSCKVAQQRPTGTLPPTGVSMATAPSIETVRRPPTASAIAPAGGHVQVPAPNRRRRTTFAVRLPGSAPSPSPLPGLSPGPAAAPPAVKSSPNELRVMMDRLGTLDRSLFDKALSELHGSILANPSTFRIEPMPDDAFIGAWMHLHGDHKSLATSELLRRQHSVQLLTETRFDSMQRFISFCVLFHAMGKACQDFWPRASFGILGYDMSRSQSIMRVATTASPVAGMEVRSRLQTIQEHKTLHLAASSIQRIWRSQH